VQKTGELFSDAIINDICNLLGSAMMTNGFLLDTSFIIAIIECFQTNKQMK